MEIKTIYDELLPEVKTALRESATKYSTAKRLKYNLMSKTMWSELTVSDVSDIITYGSLNNSELSSYSYLYGANIISK